MQVLITEFATLRSREISSETLRFGCILHTFGSSLMQANVPGRPRSDTHMPEVTNSVGLHDAAAHDESAQLAMLTLVWSLVQSVYCMTINTQREIRNRVD